MKKIVICSIPMKTNIERTVYTSDDQSVPVSDRAVQYPVNAFLDMTFKENDELKVILLVKETEYSAASENLDSFKKELTVINHNQLPVEIVTIVTEFSEKESVHESLMARIVEEIEPETHIVADITYGPKDLPIIVFTALNFAEKFLNCEIGNILYGQAVFSEGKAVKTKICDMVPLFYLGAVTSMVHTDDPAKAKEMLKTLLSI